MSTPILTAIPNVSAPCVTTNPCTCPVYGPGGHYVPIETAPGQFVCFLALEAPPGPNGLAGNPAPVPALGTPAAIVLACTLFLVAIRQLRTP